MRILLIGNPIAGRGRGRRFIEHVRDALAQRGHQIEVFFTATGGDARRRTAQGVDGFDRLIVAGGDGTMNEVLNGLGDPTATPLVLCALGTANVMARELGLPRNPAGVARLVESERVRRLDMGLAEGLERGSPGPPLPPSPQVRAGTPALPEDAHPAPRRFLALVSAGFDSMVTEELARLRKGGLGFTGYIGPIIRLIPRYRPPKLEVIVDGRKPVSGAMVVVSHVRNYGGLFRITDRAACDSGRWDVCVMHRGSVPALMSYAASALRGRMSARRDVTYLTGTDITIRVTPDQPPVPLEIDGDFAGPTPVTLRLVPGAIPLVVPA
jgi:diacylglycerol kinase (ATP)